MQKTLRIILLLTFFLILSAFYSQDQNSNFPVLKGPYLGQPLPGTTPQIFAPGIISTAGYEFAGTFSPDGKEYFFTRRPTYEGSANRIYYTECKNSIWTEPCLAPFGKDVFEFLPHMTSSGDRLYFCSERPRKEDLQGNVWYVEKITGKWSEAVYFHPASQIKYSMFISSAKNGNLYLSGIYNNKRGIYRLKYHGGEYGDPEFITNDLNGAHPCIAPDESFLIFDAQISGMGKPELFITFRNPDSSWSKAVNMGPVINATKTEYGASLSPDGKYLFFHRRVNGNGNIYWIKSEIISVLSAKTGEIK